MYGKDKFMLLVALTSGLTAGFAATAVSGSCSPGFLADVACDLGVINKNTANDLDGLNAQFNQPMGRPAQFTPPPPPQNAGAFCYTPAGRFGPGPVQPFGAQCFINSPQGPIFGQIGP
jgi:hypothetical protein